MKIVHVTTVHNPFDTRIFAKMCQSGVRSGCDVTLVAVHSNAEIVEGVRIVPIRRRCNRLARATLGVHEAVRVAERLDADVYHIHDPELLTGLRRLRKGVVVYDMHENMSASIRHKGWIPTFLRRPAASLWGRMETKLLSDIPVIFAESSYAKDYPWVECSEVILNMPRSEALAQIQPSEKDDHSVVYIGAVSPGRGSIVTLRALQILQRKNVAVRFVCAGPVSERHRIELEEFVRRTGLDNVKLTGRQRPIDAWNIAAGCTIGLATILPLPNYVESYPTKLFEYMAMGLPVVASNFPLYRSLVEGHDCGICVDPESPQQVADAIEKLLNDPALAEEMGRRGREAALSTFRWDVEFEKLLGFYRRLLSRRAAERSMARA